MAIWFIRIAVVYLVIGVLMGMAMGMTRHFEYAPVHAHVNLLGWATLALAGVLYTLYPRAGGNRLAAAHFWLQNIGLPLFALGLYLVTPQNESAVPLIIVGAVLSILGIIVFAFNIWTNAKQPVTA